LEFAHADGGVEGEGGLNGGAEIWREGGVHLEGGI
jgi:hypothetical protein